MGSVGKKTASSSSSASAGVSQYAGVPAEINKYNAEYTPSDELTLSWFVKNSNYIDWREGLSEDEFATIRRYTGAGYESINKAQYTTPWEEMNPTQRELTSNLYNGLSRYELNQGIVVNRASDFQIFGANYHENMTADDIREFLGATNGVVQNNGFMSFTTDNMGHGVEGNGLLTRLHIPPSTGAGAFVQPISHHSGENEFLVNNNAVIQYDLNSIREYHGRLIIDAYWLGQSSAQTISPTYDGDLRR